MIAPDFWSRVDKSSDCWVWLGSRSRSGYGRANVGVGGHRVQKSAHRVSWELSNGPIPDGLHVLHHCDNPPCCNPSHLFLGTNADNVADMVAKGRTIHKLSNEQAGQIKALLATGYGLTELGRRYGVSNQTIRSIATGARFRVVPVAPEAPDFDRRGPVWTSIGHQAELASDQPNRCALCPRTVRFVGDRWRHGGLGRRRNQVQAPTADLESARGEIHRLREALEQIAEDSGDNGYRLRDWAREALAR